MADIPYIDATLEVKIAGQDATGNNVNYVGADSNGNMLVILPSNGPVTPGTVASKSDLAAGQFNSVQPTLTNTQQASLQIDANGNLLTVAGKKATYSASISNLSSGAVSTDLFSITGSASKKIIVTKLDVSALQTTASNTTIALIKRSTSNTNGGLATIVQTQSSYTTTSSTTATVTVTSTGAGNLLVVATGNKNAVTTTAVSDGTTSFTQAVNAASSGGGNTRSDVWYLLSSNAGKTTITVTFSGASTTKSIFFWEVTAAGIAFDIANHITNGVSTGTDTGAAVITTDDDFIVGVVSTSGTITSNPAPGNPFNNGGAITTAAAANSYRAGPGTYTPAWSDTLAATFASSTAAFKAAGSTQPTVTGVPHDSNDSAATATVKYYLTNPTLGSSVGQVRTCYLPIQTSSAATPAFLQSWIFNNELTKGIILNNANESLNLNLNGTVISGGSFDIDIEWVEV